MTVFSDAMRWRAVRALPNDLPAKLYVMYMQALEECDDGKVPESALGLLEIEENAFYALATRAGIDRRYKYRVWRHFKGLPFTNGEERRVELLAARVTADPPRRAEHPAPRCGNGAALYRYYDELDLLLYIGITDELTDRVSDHVDGSSWMDFAARSTIERHKDRTAALAAEEAAIKAEHPLFNQKHNNTPEARRRLVEYLIEHDRLDLLAPAVSRG